MKRLMLAGCFVLAGCGSADVPGFTQAEETSKVSLAVTASVRIDCGSTTGVSPFVADEDFTSSSTIDHANTIDVSKVTLPAPSAVYQTARIGNFTYTVPGFAAGSIATVRLHFAETYFTTAGSRVFNVSINGTTVLSNFDIVRVAGANNRAFIAQFTEPSNATGAYVIKFASVVNNSLVSGIEIDPAAGAGDSGCASNTGASCNSGCGTIQCDGACSSTTANVGASCNGGCGVIECNGTCSNPTGCN
jgi:hypothetical protein